MRLPVPRRLAPQPGRSGQGIARRAAGLAVFFAAAAAAASPAPSPRFAQLQQQELRVASVSYRLALANRSACREALGPLAGFVLHSLEQYGSGDRQGAALSYGLGADMGVAAVVADSPAAKAGLVAGNSLIAVNGRSLAADAGTATGPATRAFVVRAQRVVRAEMDTGAVTLRVATVVGVRDLRVVPEAGCAIAVELVPSRDVNAWADGTGVMVTSAIVDRARADADLAVVIGHELAHDILHHRQRLASAGIVDSRLLPVSAAGSAAIRKTEEEADRLGVRLASVAGYELGGAAAFLEGLLDTNGLSHGAAATHPAPGRRLALIAAAIAGLGRPAR